MTRFKLTETENLKHDANSSVTRRLTFDDLGDFIEERERIKRKLEDVSQSKLKIDYSNFTNHVFFNSAVSKLDVATTRILTKYPYNGNSEEKEAYALTSSGYENHIFDQWPRHVGYLRFSGSTDDHLSASDTDKKLVFTTSSLMLSADVRVDAAAGSEGRLAVAIQSGTSATNNLATLRMYFSGGGAGPISFVAEIASGSTSQLRIVNFDAYSGSWHNIAVGYDRNSNIFSSYIDGARMSSASLTLGPIEQNTVYVFGGGGTGYASLSGGLDNVRLYFTSSDLLLTKHVKRQISSEDYLKLHYTFNEGTVGTASVDSGVVDYSKSALHGAIKNYTSQMRVSGAAFTKDAGDPILYGFHESVMSFTSSLVTSASFYDKDNKNIIFRLMPEEVLRADEDANGLLNSFSLAMARFFDEIKLYIDQFDNIKITNYDDVNESPDLFLPFLTKYFGWKVSDHFGDAASLSFFFGDNILNSASGSAEVPLVEIRNQFWRRTLNNLPYLLKTKGKRYNLDSYFNVLGLNKNLFSLKEYGYVENSSIEDSRIHKEKPATMLSIGTGSLSSSFVIVPSQVSSAHNIYTIEAMIQLPHASASYTGSLLTGSVWQFIDPNQVTGSFTLLWRRTTLLSESGSFVLTGSDGQVFSTSFMSLFDGDVVHVAAGLKNNQRPFIEVRTLDNDTLDFTASFEGAVELSGVFTGSKYDFVIGANSGTAYFRHATQGYIGEVRHWAHALSASELNAHAYHFENVGVNDLLSAKTLRGHWPLTEFKQADSAGRIQTIQDHSLNNRIATGAQFQASANSYKKVLLEYNHLSPSIDLKWTENKIRVRNKTELTFKDIAKDTNEVALEFNLVDALNEDISKIFSSFDVINNVVGRPVNKYRDEYADLEAYRRIYFERLSTNINFTQFFRLFRWFDKKLSDSIKQLLPARARFVGGEQVVESHFLERPRYGYKYPIFRTPVDIPNAELSGVVGSNGDASDSLTTGPVMGTYARTQYEKNTTYQAAAVTAYQTVVTSEGDLSPEFVSRYSDGYEINDRESSQVFYNSLAFVSSSAFISGGENLEVGHGSSSAYYDGLHRVGMNGSTIDMSGNLYLITGRSDGTIERYVTWQSSPPNYGASGSWVELDTHTSGQDYSIGYDIAFDSSGALYTCGFNMPYVGTERWLIRKSHITSSTTWDTIGNFSASSGDATQNVEAKTIYIASNDHIYVGGMDHVANPNVSSSFCIRKSTDRGATWTIVDSFYDSGSLAEDSNICYDICGDSSGSIYAVGSFYSGSTNSHYWCVRKSTTGNSGTFSFVDVFRPIGTETGNKAFRCTVDNNDRIWVVGCASTSRTGVSALAGYLRSSADRGATWRTTYELTSGSNHTRFYGVDHDTAGNIWFAGTYRTPSSVYDWRVLVYDPKSDRVYEINTYNNPVNVNQDDVAKSLICFLSGSNLHGEQNGNSMLLVGGIDRSGILRARKYHIKKTGGATFKRTKTSGDSPLEINNPNIGVNFKNEFARRTLTARERDNE